MKGILKFRFLISFYCFCEHARQTQMVLVLCSPEGQASARADAAKIVYDFYKVTLDCGNETGMH